MNRNQADCPDLSVEREEEDNEPLEQSTDNEFSLDVSPNALKVGIETIRAFWETLPQNPGVYRMFNADGDVLYIGKAKNLKARVGSYARGQAHSNRIARMIAQTSSMEFVTTRTETEALLLEANLIKQLQPRYNVLLRDDKSLPYIFIGHDHAAPQLAKHRGARSRKGFYFGPFADIGAVMRTINEFQRAFLLRVCTDSYYDKRERPCLLHQIKRCSAPCTGEISLEDYAVLVKQACSFLKGQSSTVQKKLADDMLAASEHMEYERAASIRDRLASLAAIQARQGVNTHEVEEADVFAIDEQAGYFCVQIFFFRNWQNWGNRSYFPKADGATPAHEVLASFIAQFYDGKPIPKLIITSVQLEDEALLSDALSLKSEGRVDLVSPKRGERKTLADDALRNAREALSRKLTQTATQEKLMAALAQALDMPSPLRRIEVYDNSHISGTNAVGAMIVAGPSGFMKAHYRTYNIKSETLSPGDDYAMMREVLTRRFSKMTTRPVSWDQPVLQEEPEQEALTDFPDWPDLILIDGGKGQLEAARSALAEIGINNAPLVGIAKGRDRDAGRETFFKIGQAPFRLQPRDPALYFVQRLRDEAHRFAIGTHRAKRSREIHKSALDEIAGIGPARKKALLNHFGTVKAMSRASLEHFLQVPGIQIEMAKKLYDHFRG
jgi:excinuclease ABC subunit C